MLHLRMPEAVKDNKIDPMCEEAELVLLPNIKKSIVRLIPVSSTKINEGQESFKVVQMVIVAPQLMPATLARMNIEQKTKTVGEEISVSTKEFFPKHDVVAPLSPSILCNTSSMKEVVIVSKTGNQQCNKKLLSQRPNIKVVRDLLTKKWIIIKANKQLCVSNLKQYRDTNAKLLSASNFKAFKHLSEVAMFLESIRKLAEMKTEKKKNMKKYKKKKSETNGKDAPE
jgi:predicted house-cleaning noncanonical NTP pyrophosphatase (MazG superfamily)